METLEKSRVCRLCGKQSGISMDIFDKNESHEKKINAILPILVHEMDLLPKQMCHRCSYKLEEFYNFYVECAKTDSELKSQLSWMRKEELEEKIVTPMVKMCRFKIKTEPPDEANDSKDPNRVYGKLGEGSLHFPTSIMTHGCFPSSSPIMSCSRCRCRCLTNVKINKNSPKRSPPTLSNNDDEVSSSANNPEKIAARSSLLLDETKTVRVNLTREYFDETSGKLRFKDIALESLKRDEDALSPGDDSSDRALRPRKGSVDYLGPRKKPRLGRIAAKFDGNDSASTNGSFKAVPCLSTSSQFTPNSSGQFTPNSSGQYTPSNCQAVIKLEKVDEAVLRQLRAKKNLEEFNKRIREFQKDSGGGKAPGKRRSGGGKGLEKDELLLRRKALQSRKRALKSEAPSSCSSVSGGGSVKSENLKKQQHKVEREGSLKSFPSLKLERCTESLASSVSSSSSSSKKVDVAATKVVVVAAEAAAAAAAAAAADTAQQCEIAEVKELIVDLEEIEIKKDAKIIAAERTSLPSLVKLEKEYACNGSYPRLKIQRHSSAGGARDNNGSIVGDESGTERRKGEGKKSRNRARESGGRKANGSRKRSSQQQPHQLDMAKIKRQVMERGLQVMIAPSELKRYCDECDVCFKTLELYKLHPCYQK